MAVFGAVGLLAGFVACTDPPRRNPPQTGDSGNGGSGGTSGRGGSAGKGGTGSTGKGGKGGSSGSGSGGKSTTSGGSSGSSNSGGTTGGSATAGDAGDAGDAGTGGAAGDGGEGNVSGDAGQGGSSSGEGGDSGEGNSAGTSGSSSGTSGSGGGGGAGPVGGGKSSLPAPPTTGVVKPAGTPGGFSVINWAGFQGAVSFTFDDNTQSQITNYAALNGVGVPLTFYLVCSTYGSNAIWAQALLDGHELGNHTMHHCAANGTNCAWGNAFVSTDAELDECTDALKSTYGLDAIYTVAAPYGDGGWGVPASTRFLSNRSVSDGNVSPNGATNPFSLPCSIPPENATAVGHYNGIINTVRTGHLWHIFLNHAFANDGYNPVSITEMVAAMTYARDLTDVWVDTVTHVTAYWRAQKLLTGVTPVVSGDDRTWSWTLPAHFPPGQYLRVKVDGGTLKQGATVLEWDDHGYYEVALDYGSVTLSP